MKNYPLAKRKNFTGLTLVFTWSVFFRVSAVRVMPPTDAVMLEALKAPAASLLSSSSPVVLPPVDSEILLV
jgi:hypothetical protein